MANLPVNRSLYRQAAQGYQNQSLGYGLGRTLGTIGTMILASRERARQDADRTALGQAVGLSPEQSRGLNPAVMANLLAQQRAQEVQRGSQNEAWQREADLRREMAEAEYGRRLELFDLETDRMRSLQGSQQFGQVMSSGVTALGKLLQNMRNQPVTVTTPSGMTVPFDSLPSDAQMAAAGYPAAAAGATVTTPSGMTVPFDSLPPDARMAAAGYPAAGATVGITDEDRFAEAGRGVRGLDQIIADLEMAKAIGAGDPAQIQTQLDNLYGQRQRLSDQYDRFMYPMPPAPSVSPRAVGQPQPLTGGLQLSPADVQAFRALPPHAQPAALDALRRAGYDTSSLGLP